MWTHDLLRWFTRATGPPEKVSIRLGRFPLFSMGCGDFYSHLSFD
jgi:hypothetical protein